jgi:hypothetical protein
MKKKALLIIPALIIFAIGAAIAMRGGSQPETRTSQALPVATQPPARQQKPPAQEQKQQPAPTSSHAMPSQMNADEGRVPAHFKTPPSRESLPPILDAEQFTGQTRAAYRAVKEIPQTIAQLPCYCYCDEGFGHKSLHSCFEDDHGAHCAVCVNEALMAYRMEKELKLTPAQIRERIIAYYGAQN